MISKVSVTNPKGKTLDMILDDPWKSGVIVHSITGLGSGMVDVTSTSLVNADGSIVSGVRMGDRNIVLNLDFLQTETESIEDIRHKVYQYFPPKKTVRLTIQTDNRTLYCDGIVEENEPDIFSKTENTQISLLCNDPYFYDVGGEEVAFSGSMGTFTFPFSNNSLTENLIQFGEIRLDTRAIVTYRGDLDTGILIRIHATGQTDAITIYNADTYEKMVVDVTKLKKLTGQRFDAGDDILISTFSGNKYARLLRNGIYTNVISIISKDADWFKISPGDNVFAFATTKGERNLIVTFAYKNAYGGI